MRKQTREDLQNIQIEKDLLKGNINRMCVTNDIDELDKMATWAKRRIDYIQIINYARLIEDE